MLGKVLARHNVGRQQLAGVKHEQIRRVSGTGGKVQPRDF